MKAKNKLPSSKTDPKHVHDFRIHTGEAPVTLMAGRRVPLWRSCECGARKQVGSYIAGDK